MLIVVHLSPNEQTYTQRVQLMKKKKLNIFNYANEFGLKPVHHHKIIHNNNRNNINMYIRLVALLLHKLLL